MSRKQHTLLQQETTYEYFAPSSPEWIALLGNHGLTFNPFLGTLQRFYNAEPIPRLQGEQQFTPSEITLLLPLLRSFPDYASYELLLTSFCYGLDGITDDRVERARKHINKAFDEGRWDEEIRAMRNVLSRTRIKLHALQLDVVSLLETGYMLHKYRTRQNGASLKNDMLLTEKA